MFPTHAWLLAPLVTPRQKYNWMQQQKSFDTLESLPINKLPTPRWVCSEDFIRLPLWMLLKVRNCRAWRSKYIVFFPQKKKKPCVGGCVKQQFIWLTKIPVRVDKALPACVFKPTATLTFHKVFAAGIGSFPLQFQYLQKSRPQMFPCSVILLKAPQRKLIGWYHLSSWAKLELNLADKKNGSGNTTAVKGKPWKTSTG